MKRISRLLILCLFLVGCARQETAIEPVFTPPSEPAATQGLYDRASNLEISSSGAVQVFPLGARTGKGLLPFGDDLLLFSSESCTTLTLLTGDTLAPAASICLDFSLEPEACALHDQAISLYDPVNQKTMVLDGSLNTIQIIPAPENITGAPVLSPDRQTLYYCTSSSIRAWDLTANLHRILRQTIQPEKTAAALYCGDTVLEYTCAGCSYFLSCSTGQLLYEVDTALQLAASEEGFIAATWETNQWSLVFQYQQQMQALTPRTLSASYYLLNTARSVVTAASSGDTVTLDYYDLTTGKRTGSQMLRARDPLSFVEKGGAVYGLLYLPDYDGQAILRWDPTRTPVSDPNIYTGPHFTAEHPDKEGLAKCQAYASQIGETYGLDILIWKEGAALAPQEVTAKPEHRVNILRRELDLLDHRLSQFPEGFLETTAANFRSLKIGLVAQIDGSIRDGCFQCFQGEDACILLSVGDTSESCLYNSLFQVIQTHILGHSSAFDQWDALNPQGFRYDYDYASNAIRNSGIYLTEKDRSFIDTFSMSYPKEDKARIFEFAMLPDQEQYFKTPAMQKKLRAICEGIRDAYCLTSDTPYPWEQYLQ